MKSRLKQYDGKRYGSVLVLTVVALMILSALGIGLLATAYGVRLQAIMLKNETAAMLAAEAGYEQTLFWMSQRQDMLTALYNGEPGSTGTLTFTNSDCDYSVTFYSFIDARPVYRVVSNGHSGTFNRTVDVLVMQAIPGWAMGKCRIPTGATSTTAVNYVNGEIIDMPLQINNLNDSPDARDIYISGNPLFKQLVAMGESRYTTGGSDKYSTVIGLFTGGICFNQPDAKITDEAAVQSKVDRFEDSTDPDFRFTPTVSTSPTGFPSTYRLPAVQLEFFVEGGVGKVRITDDCTVRGFQQSSDSRTYDYWIVPGSDGSTYERYYIYAYHVRPSTDNRIIREVDDTYVTQSFGGVESEPGGQIFVNGNVIIGSSDPNLPGANTVKDKITVVATGNIWVADPVTLDGSHDANGIPEPNNPNVLGLFAQRVVKVVDPGMTNYTYVESSGHPNPPVDSVYVPIGLPDTNKPEDLDKRHLPDPTVVEAAITTGGGGWGAENVKRGSYGGRKEEDEDENQDDLIVRGALTEAIRGVVGLTGSDGYVKKYYLDERLLEGILPGDLGLQGKYIAAPAGWHDYRN